MIRWELPLQSFRGKLDDFADRFPAPDVEEDEEPAGGQIDESES